mmetsp:Transcript_4013/g.4126  ORF Transcript_4013/g.4126 Transcript_4013/m.4126 type:complete len:1336 (+) Transcript_4013:1-4008(+)
MDFKLDNINLSLNEKNKKLFEDLKTRPANQDNLTNLVEAQDPGIYDSFQMFTNFIKEKEGLIKIINELESFSLSESSLILTPDDVNKSVYSNTLVKSKDSVFDYKNRVIMVLEEYQEQPGLLDPILETMTRPLVNGVFHLVKALLKVENYQETSLMITLNCLSQILYLLCKVRGYETVSKYFSSDVAVFEPVISFLLKLAESKDDSWTTVFILTLWTSILGLIPFDIETVDTSGLIINKLSGFYMKALTMSSNLREIAGYSASKFLTRKDIIAKGLLKQYLEWCTTVITSQNQDNLDIFLAVGVFSSLSQIFKNGTRADLEPFVEETAKNLIEKELLKELNDSNIVRKFKVKLAEKLGLIVLKPRNQTWRYKLNYREMMTGNEVSSNESSNKQQLQETQIEENMNYDLLEILIDCLLNGVVDKDYIVRWTAAKGIGRICERIDQDMVNDILVNIFGNLEKNEEAYLQGSCLAIAELCKRGLILPEQLDKITDLMQKILLFEVNKGGFCSGANVRDSACYVVWALARAYSPEVMKSHVSKLSTSLVLAILFDKEVNIRRAASAAFQEHVGRQGFFPHGIEIITEADYFTLGNRTNSYLNISLFIAQYPEYYESIVTYLASNRLYHSDISIRQNSAECLGLLVPFNKTLYTEKIIKLITSKVCDSNINTRHGALLGIAYSLVGLKGKWDFEYKSRIIRIKVLESMSQNEKKVLEDSDYRKAFEKSYSEIRYTDYMKDLPEEIKLDILRFPKELNFKGFLKAKGAEIMRNGINVYIKLLATAEISLTKEDFFVYCDILCDNLKHPIIEIQEEACSAFSLLMKCYYPSLAKEDSNHTYEDSSSSFKEKVRSLLKDCLQTAVLDESVVLTRGYSMIISEFNEEVLKENIQEVTKSLLINVKPKKTENNDAETRRISIEALAVIIMKLLNREASLKVFEGEEYTIMKSIVEGFSDYEIDRKLGDVGSKVRESCLKVFPSLMFSLLTFGKPERKLFEEFIEVYLKEILKQLAEKMNKIRLAAGNSLEYFFTKIKKYLEGSSEEDYINNNTNKPSSSQSKPNLKFDYDYISSIIRYYEAFISNFVLSVEVNHDIKLIQHYESIRSNSLIEKQSNTQWLEPSFSFPLVLNFLNKPEFTQSIFSGLIFSIGGITEDVSKISTDRFEAILNQNPDLAPTIFSCVISLFEKNKKDDLVITSVYSTLDVLLSKSSMRKKEFLKYLDKIQRSIIEENSTSTNIHKILICPDIYYNILLFDREDEFKCHFRALKSLLFLIAHKYPVVRKKAADKLYLYLLTLESPEEIDLDQDTVDTVGLILAENDWNLPVKEVTPARNEVADLLKVKLK